MWWKRGRSVPSIMIEVLRFGIADLRAIWYHSRVHRSIVMRKAVNASPRPTSCSASQRSCASLRTWPFCGKPHRGGGLERESPTRNSDRRAVPFPSRLGGNCTVAGLSGCTTADFNGLFQGAQTSLCSIKLVFHQRCTQPINR